MPRIQKSGILRANMHGNQIFFRPYLKGPVIEVLLNAVQDSSPPCSPSVHTGCKLTSVVHRIYRHRNQGKRTSDSVTYTEQKCNQFQSGGI